MPCFSRNIAIMALGILFSAFIPNAVFASNSCECFCGVVGTGAVDKGAMTQSKCESTCKESKTLEVGCFTDPSQYPVENDTCWTQTECGTWSDSRDGTLVKATWGKEVPYDCGKTKSGEQMRYCYANDVPYQLNIGFGSASEVQNLSDYINIVYAWLLPAATLVAVVMMMIGGLQYTLARGKAKYIDKAKTRITNAITGVVILLCIFVFLNLIDPRLTSLNALKIPLIKEVVLLDPNASCERLADYGYTITPKVSGSTVCGSQGTITSVSGLKGNVYGSWKENDVCDYQACTETGKSCIAYGDKNVCGSCAMNVSPSVATCAIFEQSNAIVPGEDRYVYCRYDPKGTNFEADKVTKSAGACYGVNNAKYSTENYLNCEKARADATPNFVEVAEKKNPGCSYYETLNVFSSSSMRQTLINTEQYADFFAELCASDPCGLASASGASRCVYNTGSVIEDYFYGKITSVSTGYFCRTVK
jgi:hypothetical protein